MFSLLQNRSRQKGHLLCQRVCASREARCFHFNLYRQAAVDVRGHRDGLDYRRVCTGFLIRYNHVEMFAVMHVGVGLVVRDVCQYNCGIRNCCVHFIFSFFHVSSLCENFIKRKTYITRAQNQKCPMQNNYMEHLLVKKANQTLVKSAYIRRKQNL